MISSRIYIQILVAVISGIFLVVAAAIPFFLNHPTETIKKPNFAIPVGGDDFKDTGLKINNNDIVEISCDGRYRIGQGKEGGGEWEWAGPNGNSELAKTFGERNNFNFKYDRAAVGEVIGKIGKGNKIFPVGEYYKQEAAESGNLFLMINDAIFTDNVTDKDNDKNIYCDITITRK